MAVASAASLQELLSRWLSPTALSDTIMRTPFLLLKYVGKALLNVVGGGIASDLLVETLPEIAKEVWDLWSKDRNEQQRRAEVEAIAQAAVEEVRQQVAEIKQALVPNKTPEIDLILESYLTPIPAMVRKSLRRPSDPTGTTVSTDLVPRKADDLLAFLPVIRSSTSWLKRPSLVMWMGTDDHAFSRFRWT